MTCIPATILKVRMGYKKKTLGAVMIFQVLFNRFFYGKFYSLSEGELFYTCQGFSNGKTSGGTEFFSFSDQVHTTFKCNDVMTRKMSFRRPKLLKQRNSSVYDSSALISRNVFIDFNSQLGNTGVPNCQY